jgi:hypothetical protein
MAGRVVSTRYLPTVVTVPAGTTAANPQETPIACGDVILDEIRLTVPSGHFGLTGIQFRYADTPIVPWNDRNGWLIGDNFRETFTVNFEVSSPLVVVAYNTDQYVHSFYVYLQVSDIPAIRDSAAVIVPIA